MLFVGRKFDTFFNWLFLDSLALQMESNTLVTLYFIKWMEIEWYVWLIIGVEWSAVIKIGVFTWWWYLVLYKKKKIFFWVLVYWQSISFLIVNMSEVSNNSKTSDPSNESGVLDGNMVMSVFDLSHTQITTMKFDGSTWLVRSMSLLREIPNIGSGRQKMPLLWASYWTQWNLR